MRFPRGSHSWIALDYAKRVISGKIPACLQIRQATKRFVDDLKRTDILYSQARADHVCDFVSNLDADHWVDASYEADLAYMAGCTMATGREAISTYNEAVAGVSTKFGNPASTGRATYNDGQIRYDCVAAPLGLEGEADLKVQAYNWRMMVTDDPARRIPWPMPPGYDRGDMIKALGVPSGLLYNPAGGGHFALVTIGAHAPNKYQSNQSDIMGPLIYEWATASHTRRVELMSEIYYWFMGAKYYYANDPGLSQTTRNANLYGLCTDEFQTDYYHVPGMSPQLYVRESRRLVGQYVIDEHHLEANPILPDPITTAGYPRDSHSIQRYPLRPTGQGTYSESRVHPEGEAYGTNYSIPFRALKPHIGQARNLLVPMQSSVSRIVWCSYRMEPGMMSCGDVSGMAISEAISRSKYSGDVSYAELQPHLAAANAVTRWV